MSNTQMKIPTIVALFLVAALSLGGLTAYDKVSRFINSARNNSEIALEHLSIQNLTDSSLVIVWTTPQPIASTVTYEDNNKKITFYDIRDNDQIPKPYKVHYVPVKNLKPGQKVQFQINQAKTIYHLDPVSIPPSLSNPPQILPIYGSLETIQGNPTQGAIVTVKVNEEAVWSAFVYNKKSWIIPLSLMRTKDGQKYYCNTHDCDTKPNLNITIIAEEGTVMYTTTGKHARPVEKTLIIGSKQISTKQNLSKTASVSLTPQVQGVHTTPTPTPTSLSTPYPTKKVQKKYTVSILTPKKNARLVYPKPFIRGEGIPGNTITIVLESSIRQVDTVTVGKDGTWLWTPKVALSPGIHTVTITTKDTAGKRIKIARTFTILKSGQQVLAESTPSGIIVSPTPTPTSIPFTPTPSLFIPTNTPIPSLPVSGNTVPFTIIILSSLLFIIAGFAVL